MCDFSWEGERLLFQGVRKIVRKNNFTHYFTHACKILHTRAYNFTHARFLHTGPEPVCVFWIARIILHTVRKILYTRCVYFYTRCVKLYTRCVYFYTRCVYLLSRVKLYTLTCKIIHTVRKNIHTVRITVHIEIICTVQGHMSWNIALNGKCPSARKIIQTRILPQRDAIVCIKCVK